ncbi:hypothetical protein ACWC4A_54250 [Streptomyces mirabilis]
MPTQGAADQRVTTFRVGDYVLYRDPERFWRGEQNHTFVCRVDNVHAHSSGGNRYRLITLAGALIPAARGAYMRLLPPADAMRDIDTAPLNAEGAADDMTAAATAWLVQQHAKADRRPRLPAQQD